jgi:hypothetical protein
MQYQFLSQENPFAELPHGNSFLPEAALKAKDPTIRLLRKEIVGTGIELILLSYYAYSYILL